MLDYKAPIADMQYLLHEVFNVTVKFKTMPMFEHIEEDLVNTVLDETAKICEKTIAPLNRSSDEEGVRIEGEAPNTQVITAKGLKEAFTTWAEGGWVGLGGAPEYDGQGMPKTVVTLVEEMLSSSGCGFSLYSVLTAGAALAIHAHASEALKREYLPKMYSGEWAGAMALTESHSGTDLGLIRTKAEENGDGSYAITGSKMFITGGDQDLTENIIHLVLAKLPDAPAGAKGISLFLVPKVNVSPQGDLLERNAMHCSALEEKMGIHASSTCLMHYDGAKGYLVGEINKGLAGMFTMMNYERLSVGIQGLGIAQLSYQGACEYAKERLQSRAPNTEKQGTADPIIMHGDVRRMLMTQRAMIEGGRAFAVYTGLLLDEMEGLTDTKPNEAIRKEQLMQLLTPVAKAFLTDMGFDMSVMGQQVYGGHGYIREWGMEQLVRDARITQIYEGTNGIQAMDLIGRKLLANKGIYLSVYLREINAYIESITQSMQLMPFTESLKAAVNTLEQVTRFIFMQSEDKPYLPGTAAVDYLHLVGHVSFAYMWTKMAEVSLHQQNHPFHDAKVKTGLFYIQHLLVKISAHAAAITAGADTTMSLSPEQF